MLCWDLLTAVCRLVLLDIVIGSCFATLCSTSFCFELFAFVGL